MTDPQGMCTTVTDCNPALVSVCSEDMSFVLKRVREVKTFFFLF